MQTSKAGSIYLIVLGLALVLAGGIFTWLLGRSYLRAKEMTEWPSVPAMILKSEVEERQIGENVEKDYRFDVLFGYEFEGERHTSDQYGVRGSGWKKSREKVEAIVKNYQVGDRVTCKVNPENTSMAILKVDTRAAGYSIWFPLLFVVGGIGLIIKALSNLLRKNEANPNDDESRESI